MSSKFKIRAIKDAIAGGWVVGDEFYAEYVNDGRKYEFVDNDGDSRMRAISDLGWTFSIIPEAPSYQSPVKERVVKEIRAGDYHKVCVEYSRDGKNDLRVFTNLFVNPTAQDLRHAARVFNELAEALEEK